MTVADDFARRGMAILEEYCAARMGAVLCSGDHSELADTVDIPGYACRYCRAAL